MENRAYIESLLEGVPLPATPTDLAEWAKRNGDKRAAKRPEGPLAVALRLPR